ncbi:MAG: hypothetical protein NTY53_17865, partial [Kiritimatiellaeota bacterium]|nr:hypothetical protein [Kiritimatiellota bacterium]
MLKFGTKWPSMMSTCSASEPAASARWHSSASRPISAARMDGIMKIFGIAGSLEKSAQTLTDPHP